MTCKLLFPFFFVFLLAHGPDAYAQSRFSTKANYAIVVDVKTRSVLFQKNPDELMAPASMSKLMTLAVVFEKLQKGELTFSDKFVVSENAWRNGGAPSGTSAMFAPLGKEVTVEDLVRGIVVQSGNDACIILAEALSGSEQKFSEEMEAYGRKIGLRNSNFRNSTGLPNPEHLMTARDLALLSIHLIQQYPEYYPLFGERLFKYRRHRFYNRNPLVSQNIGVDGLKTGFTKESGYGLVASSVRKGQRLLVIVNGLRSRKERGSEARKLLNWGYRNFKPFTLFDENESVGYALVWGGDSHYIDLVGDGPIKVLLPRSGDQRVKASIVYQGPLKPPIKKGDQVAELRVTTSTKAVNIIPLYAKQDVDSSSFFMRGLDSLLYAAFGWIL